MVQNIISSEYEEKFTSGQGGQTDGRLIMIKKIRCYKISHRASDLDRFFVVTYKTVTHLLQDRQQNERLLNALTDIIPRTSCLQYACNINPYHFLWGTTATESLYKNFAHG
jgi:hypothetical protein